jgi:hypothetical protein
VQVASGGDEDRGVRDVDALLIVAHEALPSIGIRTYTGSSW